MTSIIHALNTGTLAAWLSVAGFGTVGVLIPDWLRPPTNAPAVEEAVTQCVAPDIALGEGNLKPLEAPENPADPTDPPPTEPPPETLEIPAMPELTDLPPLPEIPELPPVSTPEKPSPPSEWSTRPKETQKLSKPSTQPTVKPGRNPTTSSSSGSPEGKAGAGSAMTDGARLASGRMPAPNYPAAARRAGQTGTVTIAFTVDNSGKVISAHAVNPSPWPLLNEEAVRTVRRWKFPPGGVMKLQRPIVFQLR